MGGVVSPIWDGQQFVVGQQRFSVLEYSDNDQGWSDELTDLHEKAVGNSLGHPIDIASRKDALDQICQYVSFNQAVILEIGCSSGFLINDLICRFSQAVIIGADVVKRPLYKLAKKFPGIPFLRFDIVRCPLPNNSIDVIVMLNVLEHIQDDVKALKKIFELLKPGGLLVIEVPAFQCLYDSYDKEVCHFRRYSSAELSDKLLMAGFKLKRKTYLGFILFPAFAAIKFIEKLVPSRKNTSVVFDKISSTSSNPWVRWALEFESQFLSKVSLPFGIRVLAVAQKQKENI